MSVSLFQRWDTWWARRVPPHALVITRIAWGLFCFIYLIVSWPNLTMMFSDQGVLVPLFDGMTPAAADFLFQPSSPAVVHGLYAVLLLSQLSFAAGYRMRLSILSILLLSLYFW